jgi:hypothetical protein
MSSAVVIATLETHRKEGPRGPINGHIIRWKTDNGHDYVTTESVVYQAGYESGEIRKMSLGTPPTVRLLMAKRREETNEEGDQEKLSVVLFELGEECARSGKLIQLATVNEFQKG